MIGMRHCYSLDVVGQLKVCVLCYNVVPLRGDEALITQPSKKIPANITAVY